MYDLLETGRQVITHFSKQTYEVEYFIGGGGQGEVYQAKLVPVITPATRKRTWDILQVILGRMKNILPTRKLNHQPNNTIVALKWYYPSFATPDQRTILERLIKRGAPNPENNKFLWPIDLVSASELSGFGYIMSLRDERFKGLKALMDKKIDPTFGALTTAGFELADSFFHLHSAGLCYGDISLGNVSLDPATGDIRIGDNDNVIVNRSISRVLGTLKFMAPEIMIKKALPSIQTDLYSLAVLLFYVFMLHHPLDGKKEADIQIITEDHFMRLYGTEPLFIFDPQDPSNRPVRGYQDNPLQCWPVYPQFLRDLFTRAFTNGIRNPDQRVTENEWRNAMIRLRDSIFYCSGCHRENFYDVDNLRASHSTLSCWACGQKLQLPPRIRFGSDVKIVMLHHGTKLFPHHIQGKTYDFSQPVAEVVRYQSILGLKNHSHEIWNIMWIDGTRYDTGLGNIVPLRSGVKIVFGNTQGEIKI